VREEKIPRPHRKTTMTKDRSKKKIFFKIECDVTQARQGIQEKSLLMHMRLRKSSEMHLMLRYLFSIELPRFRNACALFFTFSKKSSLKIKLKRIERSLNLRHFIFDHDTTEHYY
jgi:hypothetical protein